MLSSIVITYCIILMLTCFLSAVPCGSRLVVLLSILKHLFEKEASTQKVREYCNYKSSVVVIEDEQILPETFFCFII